MQFLRAAWAAPSPGTRSPVDVYKRQGSDDRRNGVGGRRRGDDAPVGVEGGIQEPFVFLSDGLPESAGDGEEGHLSLIHI